jgi:hypothetical protein
MSLLVSCTPEQGTPENQPPPPPSPEETREAARRLWQGLSSRKADQGEDLEPWRQRSRSEISQFKSKHGVTATGQQEILSTAKKSSDAMQQAMDEGRWKRASVFNDQVLALDPSNSRALRAKKNIDKELNKPKVVLTGFFHDRNSGELRVLFEVTDRNTGAQESVDAEVGDEFFGYKLKSVVGNNQGAIIEYLDTRGRQTLMMGQR